jgi:hypothetical protein
VFRTPISRFLAVLAGLFALEFAVLAIGPTSRSDWMLENALSTTPDGATLRPLSFIGLARELSAKSGSDRPRPGSVRRQTKVRRA